MKLHVEMLQRIVEVPAADPQELRQMLDDLGLEVKGIETDGAKVVFNIETLANRGDHLYALGIAREVSARHLSHLKVPPMAASLPERQATIPVRINTPKCPRYGLLEMQLPDHMAARPEVVSAMGENDHHAIVDTLNYIQLELGQPMHAFDKDKIDGEIRVELSESEEEIEALDGKTYRIPSGSILIKDRVKTVAVGGVIGCANSMVGPGTARVLIESASFDPVSVRLTARGMGISTDASYLFERGCDPEMVQVALKRLAYLVSGTPGVSTSAGAHVLGFTFVEIEPVAKRQVVLRLSTLRGEFNLPRLNETEVAGRLKCLGYGVKQGDKEFTVSVPSWRLWDVENEADLVEDFIRSHGLGGVKQELPPLDEEEAPLNDVDIIRSRLDEVCHGNGFFEVISQSFCSSKDVDLLGQLDPRLGERLVVIKNAVESNNLYMRASAVLHHLRLAVGNLRMGVRSFKVYEHTRYFQKEKLQGGRYDFERDMLVFSFAGRWYVNEWRQDESSQQKSALFSGFIENLGRALGVEFRTGPSDHPFFHPGMQARITVGRTECGVFGMIHPLLREAVDARTDLFFGEFDIVSLLKVMEDRPYPVPSDYPMIRRDVTLKVPARSYASKIESLMREAGLEHLVDISIVDEFRKADENYRRVTYRLTFQSGERTLEHTEVDGQMQTILQQLNEKHGIELAA